MLLTVEQFNSFSVDLAQRSVGDVGFDFETTGFDPYKGHKAFIMGFTNVSGDKYSVALDEMCLPFHSLHLFFSNPLINYCAHNAKFEAHFLRQQFGISVKGKIWDTMVMVRIERNNHMGYDLQVCAERLGLSKHPPMLDWLKIRGNKNQYHKAPRDIIVPYVEQDAWLSWILRQHQVEVFQHWDKSSPSKIKPVVGLERAVLKSLFEMERNGLLVDVGYCRRAAEYERECIEKSKRVFTDITGAPFVDSRKTLKPVFDAHGIRYGQTALGNASFTEENLISSSGHPIVATVLAHRRSVKRLSAYWQNFLDLEHNGIIHPSIHQNSAKTGRMSISNPSCQNWSTDEDETTPFPIRRAFIARENCVIASLDYSQMELRKSADEAEDHPMIEKIKGGADLHQEVAEFARVPRSLAKNGRFAKQYGAGIGRIALTLGISMGLAETISHAIEKQAQATTAYSQMLSRTCRPFGTDWLGRRFYFDPGFEYKAFNYRIQGGCAEILKIAIHDVGIFMKENANEESFMILPIHDEILINLHKEDMHLLPEIKRLMIAAQRDKKILAMDVDVEVGPNFYDLEKVAV